MVVTNRPAVSNLSLLVLPSHRWLDGIKRLRALDGSYAAQADINDEEEQDKNQDSGEDVGCHLHDTVTRFGRLQATPGSWRRRE